MAGFFEGLSPILEGIQEAINLLIALDPQIFRITALSLIITLSAVLIGSVIAIPLGSVIAYGKFRGRNAVIWIIQTLYAFPTVVIGLIVFLFLRNNGPLGALDLLFTPQGMIIGQTVLVLPIITGLTISALAAVDLTIRDTITSLGATRFQFLISALKEARFAILAAIALAFGRAISEVGAAIIIGGNIASPGNFWTSTRTLTTAITLETGKGDIALSIALGIILLLIALVVNVIISIVQNR